MWCTSHLHQHACPVAHDVLSATGWIEKVTILKDPLVKDAACGKLYFLVKTRWESFRNSWFPNNTRTWQSWLTIPGHTIHILSTTTSSTTLIIPEIIFKGLKIMYCKINNQLNIRMLDSLNFLPMALSQLPKSFGLEELKKGYFTHLYNAPEYE